jgi:hypothetical protein
VRTLLLGIVTTVALGLAQPALAEPQSLLVTSYNSAPGAKADTDIDLSLPASAGTTAKFAVYAPTGTALDVSAAPGGQVGTVEATLTPTQGGADIDMTGTITADDPAKYAADPVAQACAAGTHRAVWLVSLSGAGQTLQLPIFVDQTTGTDVSLGGYILQACPLSPEVPPDQGGAAVPDRVTYLDLETTGVVTNAATAGIALWRALITNYTAGTTTADPNTTVEVRCEVPLPHRIAGLKTTYSKKTHKVTITGTLVGGTSPRAGVHVRISAGTRPRAASLKPWALATTDRKGRFRIVKPLPGTLYAFVYVNPYVLNSCSGASTAPGGCVNEWIAPELGPLLTLRRK